MPYSGETRVFSAGLTIREMFEDREKFKRTVQDKIQHDMDAVSALRNLLGVCLTFRVA